MPDGGLVHYQRVFGDCISQTIDFPSVYVMQSKVNKQNILISKPEYTLTTKQLIQGVQAAYYDLWIAEERQRIWLQQDSIFTDFENAASLRYQTGETNKLELISSQARLKEIQLSTTIGTS